MSSWTTDELDRNIVDSVTNDQARGTPLKLVPRD